MKKTTDYKIVSISFASYTSIFLALIPIIYTSNGFSANEIAFLSSLYTLGAVIQPLFSIHTQKYGIKNTLLFNMFILFISCFVLFITKSFLIYAIFIFIYYIFQAPNIGLIDNYLKLISEQEELKFGILRSYVSAGWGIGAIGVLPFMYFFPEKVILLLVIILILLTIFYIKKIELKPVQNNTNESIKAPKRQNYFKNKEFLAVLIISTLLMGTWSIKSSFQTLLIISKTDLVSVVSIISVISILTELFMIPRVENLYRKFGYKKLVFFAILAGFLLTFGYYKINNIILLILLASLHGLLCGTMIPLNIFKVRDVLGLEHLNSAILTMYSIQNIFAFIVMTLFINNVYINWSVSFVYLILSFILLVTAIINSLLDYND